MRSQAEFDKKFCEIVAPVHDELAAGPIVIDEAADDRVVRCVSRILLRGDEIGPKSMAYVHNKLRFKYGLDEAQADHVLDLQMVRQLDAGTEMQREES